MAATTKRWWSEETVAVVTGSDKGMGFEIVRQLAKLGITTVLTCRDVDRGEAAVNKLREEGLLVEFHQLDVSKVESAHEFAHWLKQQYGGVDILVNNASILGAPDSRDLDNARKVMQTNYYGLKHVTEAMMPLLRPSTSGARIVNVSSRLGQFSNVTKATARLYLDNLERLSDKVLEGVIKKFFTDVKLGRSNTWATLYPHYSMSKCLVNAYTRMLARDLCERPQGARIYVNSFSPGYSQTDVNQEMPSGSKNPQGTSQSAVRATPLLVVGHLSSDRLCNPAVACQLFPGNGYNSWT